MSDAGRGRPEHPAAATGLLARLPSKDRCKQLAFFGALLGVTLFLLAEAWKLEFTVRGTIGPGFYPAVVLIGLSILVIVALVELARRRELVLLSPFTEGLRNDSVLRSLAAAAARPLGMSVRVVPRNGAGEFSALRSGARSTDGATVTVVSSETPDLTPAESAAWTVPRYRPVARLFFDPDVLVARPGASAAVADRPARIGFIDGGDPSPAMRDWLAKHFGAPPAITEGLEVEALHHKVVEGSLDAGVLPLRDAGPVIDSGDVAAVVVFGAVPEDTAGLAPLADETGTPLVSGAWAGLALPAVAPADAVDPVNRAFETALAERRRSAAQEADDRGWSITSPARFGAFLEAIRTRGGTAVAFPTGRLAGLLTTIAATLVFFWVMEFVGFPLAAFLFLAGLMLLLEPRLDRRILIRIPIVAAALALGLYQVFWRIFYVVFPDGLLFGS